jgi:hypothetical protein
MAIKISDNIPRPPVPPCVANTAETSTLSQKNQAISR